jgi:hypothetical protein
MTDPSSTIGTAELTVTWPEATRDGAGATAGTASVRRPLAGSRTGSSSVPLTPDPGPHLLAEDRVVAEGVEQGERIEGGRTDLGLHASSSAPACRPHFRIAAADDGALLVPWVAFGSRSRTARRHLNRAPGSPGSRGALTTRT